MDEGVKQWSGPEKQQRASSSKDGGYGEGKKRNGGKTKTTRGRREGKKKARTDQA